MNNMIHFSGYFILPESRNKILETFPPAYPDVICHHITVDYGVSQYASKPEAPESVEVVGVADDGNGVQGLLVAINGTTQRPSGGCYHITLSIDRSLGKSPVDTNGIINDAVAVTPLSIKVEPKIF